MHAPRRLDGVGGRVRERVGKSGKGASHRHLLGARGWKWAWGRGHEGRLGRTGGQFLPSPRSLFVPYFSTLPYLSYLLPSLSYSSRSLCSLFLHSVPYLFPLCSLSVPYSFLICSPSSPRYPHIFPPGPVSVPPFPRFHTRLPTWIYLSVCTSVPRHPCVCTQMHQCASTPVPICTLIHPYIPWWIPICMPGWASLPTPWCTPVYTIVYAWVPTWMPSHIPPCASTPAHPGVHISVHMDVPLDVRMGMGPGVFPSVHMGVHLDVCLGICLGVRLGVRIDAHIDTYGCRPALPPGCTHISVPICRPAPRSIRPYAR